MTTAPTAARTQFSIQRNYAASIDEAWALWTTKSGIESWWGPEGFTVSVRKLDLRPGGEMLYAMMATGPGQIQFMKDAGMPLTTEARVTYTEVVPMRRLAYTHLINFIPGVEAYDVATVVEFSVERDHVRMVIHLDAMHSEEWTQRAISGWESQLLKADGLLRRSGQK